MFKIHFDRFVIVSDMVHNISSCFGEKPAIRAFSGLARPVLLDLRHGERGKRSQFLFSQ